MFLQSSKEKQQKLAQQLWEEKQMNEELPGQISSLHTEASLHCENSQLERNSASEAEAENSA